VDTDGSGGVTETELIAYLTYDHNESRLVDAKTISGFRKEFKKMDTSGNNLIELDEVDSGV